MCVCVCSMFAGGLIAKIFCGSETEYWPFYIRIYSSRGQNKNRDSLKFVLRELFAFAKTAAMLLTYMAQICLTITVNPT